MKKILLAATFISLSAAVHSQQPVLNDLVPFKQGTKWGLVHYDGKEFYKPVFDTIVFRYSYPNHGFCVFQNEDGEMLAQVVLNKKKMLLTQDKKLKPGNYFLRGYDDKNEVYDDAINAMVEPEEEPNQAGTINAVEVEPGSGLSESEQFSTGAGVVRIERSKDTLHFYLNDNEVPEFSAFEYSRMSVNNSPVNYLLIRSISNSKYGVASLAKQKFTAVADYDQLEWEGRWNGIRASRNNKTGVIGPEGNIILPLKYDNVSDGFLSGDNCRVFNTMDINSRSFGLVTVKNNIVSESPVRYDWLEPVHDSTHLFFIAAKNKKTGVVTATDSVLIPIKYDNICGATSHTDDKRFFILQSANKLYGFADPSNKFFRVEPMYTEIGEPMPVNLPNKLQRVYLFPVRKNGRFFYIDNHGKEFISK
jgi:hypothetical protein